ncbi:MAG: TonB-dependent receptor [Candidatus Neomarinimicrobiota bacterium]
MVKNRRIALLCFSVCLIFSQSLFAATTGKIAGVIRDDQTNAPLVGANIIILQNGNATSLGAATDAEGYYAILNVEPGIYEARASYVGYGSLLVTDIKVNINLTSELNVRMNVEAIGTDEVVVMATRSLLKDDSFASTHNVTSEEMQVQPIDNFMTIAQNQPGVVGSHFRGGRSGEVLVVVDGMPVRDPASTYSGSTGGFTLGVPTEAITEMEVSLGGLSAEYGNVQSGVINVATDAGSKKLSGKVTFMTTDFGSSLNDLLMPLDKFKEKNIAMFSDRLENDTLGVGQDSLRNLIMPRDDRWYTLKYQHELQNVARLTLSGPIIPNSDRLTFSLSADLTNEKQDYFINNTYSSQKFYGKLTAKLNDKMKLSASGMYSSTESDDFYIYASKYGPADEYWKDIYYYDPNPDVRSDTAIVYHYVDDASAYQDSAFGIGRREQIVVDGDTLTWYDQSKFRYVYLDERRQDYLWDREREAYTFNLGFTHQLSSKTYYEIKYQNMSSKYKYGVRDVDDRDGDGDRNEFLNWDFDGEGPHYTNRVRENNIWWTGGDDPGYRDQLSQVNKLKIDLESQLSQNHQVRGGLEFTHNNMDVTNIAWSQIDFNAVDSTHSRTYFRTDIWSEDNIDFGLYIQDKMEFKGLVALVGLRYDYFNPSGFGDPISYPSDFSDPFALVDSNGVPILTDPMEAEPTHQISPRFGISYPITDRDKLMFTYGHYFQRPDSYYLYRNLAYDNLTTTGNYIGNPSLKAEKTVSYDISVEHLFSPTIKLSVTGYYKDVTNLMNYQKYVFVNSPSDGNIYVNADYANIKGVEFALYKTLTDYWGAAINYTYSSAQGRLYNDYNAPLFGEDKKMFPLGHDQTHTINANITLKTPDHLSPVLRNWRANFQVDVNSGSPYSSYGTGQTNDLRMPWTYNIDMRLNRRIKLGEVKMDVFLDVYNLLNSFYITYINSTQFYNMKNDAAILRQDVDYSYIYNPEVYNDPRQFRLGLSVQF